MDQYKDQLITFVQDRWMIVAVVIIAIIIIIKVVKSIMKWLLIIGLAAAILIYGSNYSGEITDNIKEIGAKIANYTKDEAIKAMLGEGESAHYESKADGGFVVTTGGFTLEGAAGSQEAVLSYKGQSITLQLDDTLRAFVDGAKSAQSTQ